MIKVERVANRIYVNSADSPIRGLGQHIPGAYWSDHKKVWSVPLDLVTCRLLRERFGDRLRIGPALTRWARDEQATRDRAEALAGAETADLEIVPKEAPTLHAGMADRPYQRTAVRFIADTRGRDNRRRALLADTVGLGKTAEALGAVVESWVSGPYLVVCPLTAVENTWRPEINRWLPEAEVVTLPAAKKERQAMLTDLERRDSSSLARTWVVVHPYAVRTQTWWECWAFDDEYDENSEPCLQRTKYKAGMVQELDCGHVKSKNAKTIHEHVFPELFGIEWGAVLADESDQILIRKTGTPNLQRRGMEMLRDLVVPGGTRIAMSGTPFRSKPHQMWSTLNWLDPVRWSSKWSWIQRFWRTGGYSGYEIIKDGFMEEREHMMLDDLKDVMIRRTREEVRADLPAKLYPSNVDPETSGLTPGVYLSMTKKQAATYAQMVKEGVARLAGGDVSPVGTLAELGRLKQFAICEWVSDGDRGMDPIAAGNKWEWLLELLEATGLPNRPETKVVIASQFTKILNAFAEGLRKEFKAPVELITGDIPTAQRQSTIARFEDPASDLAILLINTKAGGSSITLDAADVMVILDETWVDDEQQQLEGRIDNRNPERKIAPRSYYYLRSLGTLEESIAEANAKARQDGSRVLDSASIARRAKEFIK